jgi:hypothetical protein
MCYALPCKVRLMDEVLIEYGDLSERFRDAIEYDEWEEKQQSLQTRHNYYSFVSSVDFSSCVQVSTNTRFHTPLGLFDCLPVYLPVCLPVCLSVPSCLTACPQLTFFRLLTLHPFAGDAVVSAAARRGRDAHLQWPHHPVR